MKSKYSKDYKLDIIDRGIYNEVLAVKKDCWKKSTTDYLIQRTTGEVLEKSIQNPEWSIWYKENHDKSKYDCALRMIESKHNKVKKIREKVKELVETGKAVFVTLTFTDEVLSNTSAITRRRYVARYLKSQSDIYVANIDFSPKEREHYHAIIGCRCDMSPWTKYGFIFVEQIRNQDKDLKRTSNYIAKLTNHAIKVDATRLIYSRNIL